MLAQANDVAGTLFDSETPILIFSGPSSDLFPNIARNTISVFNGGRVLQDFLLTEAELDNVRDELIQDGDSPSVIRTFLERTHALWLQKTGRLKELTDRLPRPNEVWCIFCHPSAEDVVGMFATKGSHVPSAWTAYHAKLWEYVPGTQREARWDPTRLQYAIGGAFTARVMHLSPQSLVSTCAAYGAGKLAELDLDVPSKWAEKSTASRHLATTAPYRQLVGDPPSKGKTKGGPAAQARESAEKPFEVINKFVVGTGNDRHVNYALAEILSDTLPSGCNVFAERAHPWIPGITPDVRIDMPDGRQICLEFCYTNSRRPGTVADYVLDKLATYMEQLDIYVKQ